MLGFSNSGQIAVDVVPNPFSLGLPMPAIHAFAGISTTPGQTIIAGQAGLRWIDLIADQENPSATASDFVGSW